MKKINKKQLSFNKEIIVSLSEKEMYSINGGQIVKNTKLPQCNTMTDCMQRTQEPNCASNGCIHYTEGCAPPPKPWSIECTGNGCDSERGSCVTCTPDLCAYTFNNNCVRPVISIMNC